MATDLEKLEQELWAGAESSRMALDYSDQEWVSKLLAKAANFVRGVRVATGEENA